MQKGLCYGALGASALMLLLFGLDLATGVVFGGGPFRTVDVMGLLASGIVLYQAINVSRDLK